MRFRQSRTYALGFYKKVAYCTGFRAKKVAESIGFREKEVADSTKLQKGDCAFY